VWSEILSEQDLVKTYHFSAIGMQFGDKDFFVDDIYADSLSVNGALFAAVGSDWWAAIIEVLELTENAVKVFGSLAVDLALAEGRDKGERGRNLYAVRDAAREQAYFSLDIPFRTWLSKIDATGDADEVMTDWKEQARRIIRRLADEMLNDKSDTAFVGRDGKTISAAETWFNINLIKALEMSDGGKEAVQ
jgi:CRISPR system Cascade subunit CasA